MVKITPIKRFNYPSSQREHDRLDRMLDMALDLTFPGSDPVAITISTNEQSEDAGVWNSEARAGPAEADLINALATARSADGSPG